MNKPNLLMKPRVLSIAIMATVSLGVVALAIFAQNSDAPATDGPGAEPLTVSWQTIRTQPSYTVTRTLVGRVEANQESQLGFEVPGMVKQVLADEGDRVVQGQVLARLDTQLLDARREELVAARDQAKAELDLADIRLERITRAHQRKAATDDELDEAVASHLAAEANLARANAGVISIEVEIKKTELVAPYDAVVAAKALDAGRVVSAGVEVFELYDLAKPKVRLGVGGAVLDDLAVNQTHPVLVNGERLLGTIRQILPARERLGRDVDVILELDAQLDGIRRGDLARVEIKQNIDEPGAWLPIQALTEGVRGLWAVYTLEANGGDLAAALLRRSDVEVLHTQADHVFVRGVFADETQVVIEGLHRLAPGMAVRPAAVEVELP
ncbi:MAG: efflux RND transporter periplasmic adaptor subunit [Planctomycetota bacterium]